MSSIGEATAIRVLPKEVVDRIAAGEVVQRPANALKELLENSLDAGANKIVVHVEKKSGSGKQDKMLDFSISDNGHGIGKADLEVAATRFATSKLTSVDDFSTLVSFGFRGEALASISMVSHLSITSRTKESPLAHECHYVDGTPQAGHPKRCARTVGTTVKVQDLFYNVPHRRKALNPKDEYTRMLNMLQPYAVQVARRGVGIIVQLQQPKGKSKTNTLVDLNTSNLSKVSAISRAKTDSDDANESNKFMSSTQQEATKQVIKTIYGSQWEQHLLYFQSQSSTNDDADGGEEEEEDTPTSASSPNTSQQSMSYNCEGFIASPSLAANNNHNNSQLHLKNAVSILFVNNRYVECPALKRRLEDTYATLTPWKKPPFVYVTLQVPAHHVDVNVHPTKTQVALLFLEEIVADISNKVHALLTAQGKTFGEKQSQKISIMDNPYKKKPAAAASTNFPIISTGTDTPLTDESRKRKRASNKDDEEEDEQAGSSNNNGKYASQPATKTPQSSQRRRSSSSSSSATTKPPPSHKLVRTHGATPVGALEPFLVRKVKNAASTPSTAASTPPPPSFSSQESNTSEESSTQNTNSMDTLTPQSQSNMHKPPCPFATGSPTIDMTQPGAFAQASQQCTCRVAQMQQEMSSQSSQPTICLAPQQRIVRPSPVVPTKCDLGSIRTLRRRVQKRLDASLQQKLRQAYFVGVVSQHRSLVQWQEELCLLHHSNLAQSLFYQLALAHFGGNRIASFQPVQVQTVIEQVLQMEEDLQDQKLGLAVTVSNSDEESGQQKQGTALVPVNETNAVLAKQATACLWDNAAMVEDYFGIRFELAKDNDTMTERQPHRHQDDSPQSSSTKVVLTGLPILLEGHIPPAHGLPLFLLRLATEVDWDEERPCFDGVFRELGNFYSQMPSTRSTTSSSISNGNDTGRDVVRNAHIQHTLFPALSYLLMPSEQMQNDVKPLTRLSNLYKVFERC